MSYKLVYMCPICRNRIEYDINSVAMYTHEKKNVDGAIELVEREQSITTPAFVTTINPPKCNHIKDYRIYPVIDMVPVPEWVPELVDRIIRMIPDAYDFVLPMFKICVVNGQESTCSLSLIFKTYDTNAANKFVEIADDLIDTDICGYKSKLKANISIDRMRMTKNKERCIITICAPDVNFMTSNGGRGRAFFEFIRHISIRYGNRYQMTIRGV